MGPVVALISLWWGTSNLSDPIVKKNFYGKTPGCQSRAAHDVIDR